MIIRTINPKPYPMSDPANVQMGSNIGSPFNCDTLLVGDIILGWGLAIFQP
jgi:hypothetical protein